MMNDRTLLVGFDLGNDISQISCFDEQLFEPVCIGKQEGENDRHIQTILGIKDTGEWLHGKDAIYAYNIGRCELIENFVDKIIHEEPVYAAGREVMPVELLETFFKKTLFSIREYEPDKSILKLVVTIQNLTRILSDNIYLALEALGIERERTVVQSHKQSYMHFVLNQNSEFWINDVGLFDFRNDGLHYYQLTVDKRKKPYIAGIIERDYSDNLSSSMLIDEKYIDNLGYIFENVAQNAIYKQIISTLYMIGAGFSGDWADSAMRNLCSGRRVFKGQNLYVKGACYAARKMAGLSTGEDFIFIDDDMIAVHISTNVYINAGQQEVIIAKAGSLWYDIDSSIDLIPDEDSELQINVTNIITRETSKHFIPLDVVNQDRPSRMTRINVRVRFQDVHNCIITIKDKGFGDLYRSSDRISERIFEV